MGSILAAACSDPPSAAGPGPTPELREIALLDSSQWGGGLVRARSAGFVPGLPLVLAGAETLSVSRVDPVTVAIRLPGGPSGSLPLSAVLGADTIAIGSVQLYSIAESRTIEPMQWTLLPWKVDGVPYILGQAYSFAPPNDVGLAVVDLRSGSATVLRDVSTYIPYGPSYSLVSGDIILVDSTPPNKQNTYDLWPSPTMTGPSPVTGGRHVLQMNDSVWVITTHHWTAVRVYHDGIYSDTTYSWFMFDMESPWRAAVARNPARLIFVHNGSYFGTPLIDTETGDSVTLLKAFNRTRAAAFSADESVLYLVGGGRSYPDNADSLGAVLSVDGTRLHSVVIPDDLDPDYLVVDPVKPLLYLTAFRWSPAFVPQTVVRVYDTRTLELLGELEGSRSPQPCTYGGTPWSVWAASVIDGRKLHVVSAGNPSCQEIFDLMP